LFLSAVYENYIANINSINKKRISNMKLFNVW
jgi:hypothetical protein